MTKRRSAQHSQASVEHYSPLREMIEPARRVTGPFDLDPFSCPLANETVQAKRIITAAEDAFKTPWVAAGESVSAWINPPGGSSDDGSNQAKAWCLTATHWLTGALRCAWFVVFNPSAFYQRAQTYARRDGLPLPQDYPRCEFPQRIQYLHPVDGKQPALPGVDAPRVVPGTQPPHGSALLFLPESWAQVELFRKVFDPEVGEVSVDELRLERVMRRRDNEPRRARAQAMQQEDLFDERGRTSREVQALPAAESRRTASR